MHLPTLLLTTLLASSTLAERHPYNRNRKPKHRSFFPPNIPHKPSNLPHQPGNGKGKSSSDDHYYPGSYFIINQATGTAMDLFEGGTDAGTAITGYAPTANNTHQIWQVVTADTEHQVMILNKAGGSMVSCPVDPNDDDLYQMIGGQVAVDGYSKFTLIINSDKSVTFENVKDSSLCIDLSGSSSEDETPILCYPCHEKGEAENQNWMLADPSKVRDDGEDDEEEEDVETELK